MTELPPELKAMQGMMDQVFGVLKAHPSPLGDMHGDQGVHLSTSEYQQLKAPRQMDIEDAIMRAAPFDYLVASEIFAALYRRLELRYEDNLNTELEARMKKLSEAFDHIV